MRKFVWSRCLLKNWWQWFNSSNPDWK